MSGTNGSTPRATDLAAEPVPALRLHLPVGARRPGASTAPELNRSLRQLCWRDFHHQVLAARPDLPYADYRPRDAAGETTRARARRLAEGAHRLSDRRRRHAPARRPRGCMHNRARLIVASFLTKTLGHRLARAAPPTSSACSCDGDLANNVGNWQWVAGTGNDTRPNRVLNPIRQARRFDPDGTYVRRLRARARRYRGQGDPRALEAQPRGPRWARLSGPAGAAAELGVRGGPREPSQEPSGDRPVDALLGLRVDPDADPRERPGAAQPRIEVLNRHPHVNAAATLGRAPWPTPRGARFPDPGPLSRPGVRA